MSTFRVRPETIAEARKLQAELEAATGVRPALAEVLARCVSAGAEVMRRRTVSPTAYAVDTAHRVRA